MLSSVPSDRHLAPRWVQRQVCESIVINLEGVLIEVRYAEVENTGVEYGE
jgi:hypothetical protein